MRTAGKILSMEIPAMWYMSCEKFRGISANPGKPVFRNSKM